ncbi:MAG: hypothetical protein OEO77_05000, partial [Acidimicrobiia bacterium]|nr:hypothetical protein [Acidimicrobiia bacterium]
WAPPSYGEFAVPHLEERLRQLTEDGHQVILSAHSQGTVLSMAALAVLDAESAGRIRLLTHGCPLDRLYARYFPEYFDAELFGEVMSKLASPSPWRNLYRSTDYIGSTVFGGTGDDVMVIDPEEADPVLSMDPRPNPLRHSNYYAARAYGESLSEFAGLTR